MRRLLGALVLGVGGVAILIALGVWQLQRLEWKRGILADIEAKIAATPGPIPVDPDPERDKYLSVTALGHIGKGELHLLDSIQNVGPVWRIIVPFITAGRPVLLDRGYVRDGLQNNVHPSANNLIVGNLLWPDDRTSSTPPNDPEKNVWFARDIDEMAKALGTEPVLVIAREETGDGIRPLPVSTEGIPNDHLQYAITWFLLAAVWAGMTVLLVWRISRRTA